MFFEGSGDVGSREAAGVLWESFSETKGFSGLRCLPTEVKSGEITKRQGVFLSSMTVALFSNLFVPLNIG